jgi:thioredoxin 1
MSESVLEVTDGTYEAEVLKSDIPVLVDLWAPWCGPCRMVTPVIEEIAADNAGKIKTCKINVDDCPQTAGALGVTAIPTVVLVKDGQEVANLRMVGVQPKAAYQKAVDAVVAG